MFKRVIIRGLAVAAGMSAIFGCTNKIEEPFVTPAGEPSITLQLHTGKKTRATDPFNAEEEKINSVDLFFFKGTDPNLESSAAVFAWHGGSAVDDGTLNVSIPLELIYDEDGKGDNRIYDLFDRADQCTVYTIVNWSGAQDWVNKVKEGEKVTISDLRALKATTEFFATREFDAKTGIVMFTNEETTGKKNGETTEPNVVKFSDDDTKKSATGHLYVQALAAKIDLFVNFAESVKGVDPTATGEGANTEHDWKVAMRTSNSLNMTIPTAEVHLVNGVKSVRLGGWEWTNESRPADEDYFDTRNGEDASGNPYWHRLNATAGESANLGKWATNTPFYTYPNKWEISPLELHRTTLLLKVDWLPDGSQDVVNDALTTYYTVPLTLDANALEPNNYYRVKVTINTLGGQNFGEPVELVDASVEILKWGKAELEADIREVRYLRCEQTVYDPNGEKTWTDVMNNTETTTIPFYSSHKVEIASVTIRYHYYLELNEFDLDLRGYAHKYTPGDVDVSDDDVDENLKDDYEAFDKAELASKESLINAAAFTLNKEELESGQYAGVYIDEMNNTLTVYHQFYPISSTLSNGHYTYDKVDKYAPYEIVIKLRHKDDPTETEIIKIIQYPPINIVAQKNKSKSAYGDVYINSQTQKTGTNQDGWDYITGIESKGGIAGWARKRVGATTNPNMYVFTIQNLEPKDAPLHIGESRNLYYRSDNLQTNRITVQGRYILSPVYSEDKLIYSSNMPGTWFGSAPAWENGKSTLETGSGSRRLTYYYPTDEADAEVQRWMISPKFRISSSYGSHIKAIILNLSNGNPMNRIDARRRCAAYQEAGYPAGRWRLPTPGEMQYVARLQDAGIIPEIFETGKYGDDMRPYWTSHGLYEMDDDGKTVVEIGTEASSSRYRTGFLLGATANIENQGTLLRPEYHLVGWVRCVYDDWYWVDQDGNPDILPEDKITQFHWGDKEKTNPLE